MFVYPHALGSFFLNTLTFFYFSVLCESGTYQLNNTCLYCDAGSYSSVGSTNCRRCPNGTTTPGVGYSSIANCIGMFQQKSKYSRGTLTAHQNIS